MGGGELQETLKKPKESLDHTLKPYIHKIEIYKRYGPFSQ